MKQAIKETMLSDGSISKMTYKLVLPEEHWRNMAKKSIQTFKDHFVGVLSGCAKTMPMHLWCQLLPQVERQLLLPWQSRVNPGMSAYAHVYQGQHNYSKHPFVPIGMESLVHVKPHKWRTYAQHCKKGFVISTSFEHYRCQKIWMKDTYDMHIFGSSLVQAQIPDQPVSDPIRPNHCSNRWTSKKHSEQIYRHNFMTIQWTNSKNYKTSFSQDRMAKSKVHHYKLSCKFQGCIHHTNMHQTIPQCKHPMLRLQGWQWTMPYLQGWRQ